jgi:hypothetical protein
VFLGEYHVSLLFPASFLPTLILMHLIEELSLQILYVCFHNERSLGDTPKDVGYGLKMALCSSRLGLGWPKWATFLL